MSTPANAFLVAINEHYAKEDPKNIPEAVRFAVLERDDRRCQLCGKGGENVLQLHHVLFRSQGGRHLESNLVVLCWRCHNDVHAGRQTIMLAEVEPGLWRAFPGAPMPAPESPRRTA